MLLNNLWPNLPCKTEHFWSWTSQVNQQCTHQWSGSDLETVSYLPSYLFGKQEQSSCLCRNQVWEQRSSSCSTGSPRWRISRLLAYCFCESLAFFQITIKNNNNQAWALSAPFPLWQHTTLAQSQCCSLSWIFFIPQQVLIPMPLAAWSGHITSAMKDWLSFKCFEMAPLDLVKIALKSFPIRTVALFLYSQCNDCISEEGNYIPLSVHIRNGTLQTLLCLSGLSGRRQCRRERR